MVQITGCGQTGNAPPTFIYRKSRSSSDGPSSLSPLGFGACNNRRWVVTTAAVFGAIEFYTQWFERLGAELWAIIVARLTIVAFAIALWRYNLNGSHPAAVAG
jgi:hypothetical protein